jgi:hypothetical protein
MVTEKRHSEVDQSELSTIKVESRPPRYNDRLLVYPAVRIRSSRHYFCFEECAAVRCTIGCLLALIFLTTFFLPFMQLENKNNENYTL